MMSVGVSNSRGLTPAGRKSAALSGSTLTPVMSTPEEKVNAKPLKVSGQGTVETLQNGIGGDSSLVIVIVVSPTSIVDSSATPMGK